LSFFKPHKEIVQWYVKNLQIYKFRLDNFHFGITLED